MATITRTETRLAGPDLAQYRQSSSEQTRLRDLLAIVPKGRTSVLDIGCRDGYISRLLTTHFSSVTALDLVRPAFGVEGVVKVQGDVTSLEFSDDSFDVVLCAEVLEHLPEPLLGRACAEIARVARHEAVIGVPYKQDLRLGRTTCASCGGKNPPWGHVNSFDEDRLRRMFQPLRLVVRTLVGPGAQATNAAAAFLMDLSGNPWGTYNQEEPCIHCCATLRRPAALTGFPRACSKAGVVLTTFQNKLWPRPPMWIHAVFAKSDRRGD
jgi:SAM-dependent methyltransferase